MKNKILFSILLFFCSIGMKAQQPQPALLKTFEYDKRIHDFGTIQEKKGPVHHTFTFTNKGKKPVVITEVSGWCGCTSYDFPRQPIAPGKQAKVTITYNPAGRPGKFSKEIAVVLNDGKFFNRVWVKGTVIGYEHPVTEDYPYAFGSGLYMGFKVLLFGAMKPGQQYSFEQRIANDTDKPMTVEFVKVPNNRVLKMPEKIYLKPKERSSFRVTYRQVKEYSYDRYIVVHVKVNGKEVMPMRVTWFGTNRN